MHERAVHDRRAQVQAVAGVVVELQVQCLNLTLTAETHLTGRQCLLQRVHSQRSEFNTSTTLQHGNDHSLQLEPLKLSFFYNIVRIHHPSFTSNQTGDHILGVILLSASEVLGQFPS